MNKLIITYLNHFNITFFMSIQLFDSKDAHSKVLSQYLFLIEAYLVIFLEVF